MTKVLKPYTIIPPELYIKRDADRQLLNIIDDMGRPGYVLVSRQMGKTNLLLNAKREAETPDDIFVYIDLSNPFESAKDCFQNIVDTILEINEDRLQDVCESIKLLRENSENIPAHKQHTNELRKIINAIKGKLVIILDEIDALTKTDYSDRIFSQIRSIYFTRVNFQELSKLTYVLSGVVEPTEIIKDSKISPFNIGQKIFLNDFSIDEFEDLLSKANIKLKDEVKIHIYDWTNGNPRISWDVCSEIESICNEREVVIEDIDEIIKSSYLTTYDKPPIDNIRELIINDSELRNAIVEIEYDKGTSISDRIKSKLYLAGIINYTNGNIKIKNEVIRQAINLDWINSIRKEEKDLLILAIEFYNKGDYLECLSTFENYLKHDEFPSNAISMYSFYMGNSAYKLFDYNKSLEYLNQTDFDVEDNAVNYYLTQNLKGISYLKIKDYESSLACFNLVLNRNKKDHIFATAIINIGSICFHSDNVLSVSDAKTIYNDVIEEKSIDSAQISKEQLQEFKTIAYYNLAKLYVKESIEDKAKDAYEKAVKISLPKNSPRIILDLFPYLNEESEKKSVLDILESAIDSITPSIYAPDKPLDYNEEQLKEALLLIYIHRNNNFLNTIKKNLTHFEFNNIGGAIYEIAMFNLSSNNKWDISLELFNLIYLEKDNSIFDISYEHYYNSVKFLAYFNPEEKGNDFVEVYIELFKNERFGEIDFIDLEIFARYIYQLSEEKNFTEVLNVTGYLNSIKESVPEEYLVNYIPIYNVELNVLLSLKHNKQSIIKAREILELANNEEVTSHKSALLGDDGLSKIKEYALRILRPKPIENTLNTLITLNRNFSRNEIVEVRYKGGAIKKDKYKKLREDIDSGLCIVIS